MRLGRPLKNQTCEQGEASSMWPRRSRRTLLSVTSTPHLSQMTPRCFIRLYLPHRHSQSVTGPKMRAENKPSRSGVEGRLLIVSGFVTSPCDQLRIFSGEARLIRMASKSAIGFAMSKGLERYKVVLHFPRSYAAARGSLKPVSSFRFPGPVSRHISRLP